MNDQARRARLLGAAIGATGPVEPLDSDWDSWVEIARAGRVIPLLHRVALQTPALSSDHRIAATDAQLELMAMLVRFERDLVGVVDVLNDAQVDFAVLKGVATAHLDYDDPSLRQFGDVDVLIDPADRDRARVALETAGWRQAYALPGGHDRFTHAITFRNGTSVELDLHQRIAHRALGELIPTSELMAEREVFELAGRKVSALCRHDRLIHAAIHLQAARGQYRRLSSAADVIVLAGSCERSAEAVVARADGWRVGSLVEAAIRAAHAEGGLPVSDAWNDAFAVRRPRRDRLVDLAYLSSDRRPIVEELAYLRVMGSFRDRAAYVRGYFSTDPDYASQHGRSGWRSQTRYLWSRVRPGATDRD